ncbi:MAG: hypothetical protein K8J31_11485 [Anaerolineae bacterium]|nr:hypothetical protein [Anaerolineae bacterium]
MAQKQHSANQGKSDFPIFEYIDMLMPYRLVARFKEIPAHYRWLIVSILASATILWIFLTVIVGGLNTYIDSRIPRGYDALYLTYGLETRPLPELPETIDPEAPFVILPENIAQQYALQTPLSPEAIDAAQAAELEAFLGLSVPAENALKTAQEALTAAIEARVSASAEAVASPDNPVAPTDVPAAEVENVPAEAASAESAVTVVPTVEATADLVKAQAAAVDKALVQVTALNEALAQADSIQAVYEQGTAVQEVLTGLASFGMALPEVDALNARLAELATVEPPVIYRISDCLVSSKIIVRRNETYSMPCVIDPTALYVERGSYLNKSAAFDVVAAQYADHERATEAVTQIFSYARTIGRTGNFSLGPIEYDYAYSHTDNLYTMTWSHENWVYSITGDNYIDLENLVKLFPY